MKHGILLAFQFLLFVPIASAQVYTVTDLGPLSPTAINSWAQVVGNYNGHAFIWTKKHGMRDLGVLAGGTFSGATAISDFGAVTGTADGPGTVTSNIPYYPSQNCSDLTQPFIWTQRNGMQGLGSVAPPNSAVFYRDWCFELGFHGAAINDLGQTAAYSNIYGTYQWASIWTRADGMTAFGGSWPPSFTNAINNTGQIVGQNSQLDTYPVTIFLGHATSWTNGVATDLGTLGGAADTGYPFGYSSSANGINDLGQIVGYSTTAPIPWGWNGWAGSSPIHAIPWPTNGAMRDLGTLPGDEFSAASKINFFGTVIGTSGNTDDIGSLGRPFIWSERTGMQDLNTLIRGGSGWVFKSVSDINVWGQIVGDGMLNGQPHGFLLTPRNPFKL